MFFEDDTINDCIDWCGERIEIVQMELDFAKTVALGDDNDDDRIRSSKAVTQLENILKSFKVEKMIFTALLNQTTNNEIFPRFLAKFDEFLGDSLNAGSELVGLGDLTEAEYLMNCENGMKQRTRLKNICDNANQVRGILLNENV